jgi:hypothetical protein
VAGPKETVLEDAGPQSVAGWATAITPGSTDEDDQTVTLTAGSDNQGLFSSQPSVDAAGTLRFTPAANANGVATLTIRAADDGGTAHGGSDTSAPQTTTTTVTPVNDPPSFTVGSSNLALSISGLLGAQTVSNWATNIGPGNETGQHVTFVVTNNNHGLFTVQPAVSPSGTLSYTPNIFGLGSASVTVTSGGGNDTSPSQTFTITVI